MISKGMLLLTTVVVALTTAMPAARCNAEAVEPEPTVTTTAPATQDENTEPQEPKRPRLSIKPNASFFLPGNDKTKDRFGSSWLMIGIAVDFRDEDRSSNRLQFQADGISRRSGSDHATIYPIGLKFTHRLNTSRRFSPYYGCSASMCMADVRSQADNVDSGFRLAGPGGNVFIGTNVGMHVKLEATYFKLPEVKGFDLSGLSVGASLQF